MTPRQRQAAGHGHAAHEKQAESPAMTATAAAGTSPRSGETGSAGALAAEPVLPPAEAYPFQASAALWLGCSVAFALGCAAQHGNLVRRSAAVGGAALAVTFALVWSPVPLSGTAALVAGDGRWRAACLLLFLYPIVRAFQRVAAEVRLLRLSAGFSQRDAYDLVGHPEWRDGGPPDA